LIGYDWDRGEVFWALARERERMKACGVCYHGGALLVASDDTVRRFTPERVDSVELPGTQNSLSHSIHPIGQGEFGVIDTGHSCLRVFRDDLSPSRVLEPLAAWGDLPPDAIHLNDFAVTPRGIVASCFDYRPWRKVQAELSWECWCRGGYGLALNLTGDRGAGAGRVVGCGWNHPHSLVYRDGHLHLCSAAAGVFHACAFTDDGTLVERRRVPVTQTHFLRGAWHSGDGWFLGGSTSRHGEVMARDMAVYFLDDASGRCTSKAVPGAGEIYDVLPWRDDLLGLILRRHFHEPLPK